MNAKTVIGILLMGIIAFWIASATMSYAQPGRVVEHHVDGGVTITEQQ